MTASTPRKEPMAAVFAALNPYTWRSFTPDLLARRVVAAHDRQALADLLRSVPGAVVGPWDDVPELSQRDDPRVRALVEFLENHPWNQLRLPTLCRLLVRVLNDAE